MVSREEAGAEASIEPFEIHGSKFDENLRQISIQPIARLLCALEKSVSLGRPLPLWGALGADSGQNGQKAGIVGLALQGTARQPGEEGTVVFPGGGRDGADVALHPLSG